MKKSMFITAAIILLPFFSFSQCIIGFEGGVAPSIHSSTAPLFVNRDQPKKEFVFNTTGVDGGFYVGCFVQKRIREHFFVKLQAHYHEYQVGYELFYTWGMPARTAEIKSFSENVSTLTVPLSIGVQLKQFGITSGFVTHWLLSEQNDMAEIETFRSNRKMVEFGFQSGLTVNIPNVQLSAYYQLDFQNYGDHMKVNNQSLALLNSPNRLIFMLGFSF